MLPENEAAREVVDAACRIHETWGPGLLESAYAVVLEHELKSKGRTVVRRPAIDIVWEDLHVTEAFRADFIVDDCLIVELKSVERLAPVHAKQVRTYLRLTDMRLGLLVDFGAETIRQGLRRVANGMP